MSPLLPGIGRYPPTGLALPLLGALIDAGTGDNLRRLSPTGIR
jgi:hypothetical protein